MAVLNSISLFAGIALSFLMHRIQTAPIWQFRATGTHSGIEIELVHASGKYLSPTPGKLRFALYRGAEPDFAPSAKSLLGTGTVQAMDDPTLPTGHPFRIFLDSGVKLREGEVYYYKLELPDDSGILTMVEPEGLGSLVTNRALSSAAAMPYAPLDVVFIGDSITYGANLRRGDPTPCDVCARALELGPEPRGVFFANEGHSGHTTKDYLPGGQDFLHAEASASRLEAHDPGKLVFSIMLGTNDSAEAGPNGAPISPRQYEANLRAIVGGLLGDFPACKVVVNRPTWYSPNTHNGATYEEAGLRRLTEYFPVISRVPRQFAGHRVFEGDTRGYDWFAATYLSTLNAEHGQNGTFYLHPNREGAQDLGRLWAAAILRAER